MIYEMQTYTLTSRSQAAVENRIEKALPRRVELSRLGACWRTEVGLLNQIILVWPYEDLAERDRVSAKAAALDGWPPEIDEFVVERNSKTMVPAPFSPPLTPRRLGNLYEIRAYTYPSASIPHVIESWSDAIAERVKYSPLVAAWYSGLGSFSEWVHIWAYENAGERERIRHAVAEAGIWPMSVIDRRLKREPRAVSLRMQNMLVVPVSFSPLR